MQVAARSYRVVQMVGECGGAGTIGRRRWRTQASLEIETVLDEVLPEKTDWQLDLSV